MINVEIVKIIELFSANSCWWDSTYSQLFKAYNTNYLINFFLKYLNLLSSRYLVKISAVCSFISIGWIDMLPFFTCSLKWWYFIAIFLMSGKNFWLLASAMHSLSSSQVFKFISIVGICYGKSYWRPSTAPLL